MGMLRRQGCVFLLKAGNMFTSYSSSVITFLPNLLPYPWTSTTHFCASLWTLQIASCTDVEMSMFILVSGSVIVRFVFIYFGHTVFPATVIIFPFISLLLSQRPVPFAHFAHGWTHLSHWPTSIRISWQKLTWTRCLSLPWSPGAYLTQETHSHYAHSGAG